MLLCALHHLPLLSNSLTLCPSACDLAQERALTDMAAAARSAALVSAHRGCAVPTRVMGDLDRSPGGALAEASRAGRLDERQASALYEMLQVLPLRGLLSCHP